MSRIDSPDARLVELLRRSDAPSDEDMRRVRAAIGVRLAAGAAAGTMVFAATRASWATRLGTLGAWGKGALLASSLAGIGAGAVWYAKGPHFGASTQSPRTQSALMSAKTSEPAAVGSSTPAAAAEIVAAVGTTEPDPKIRTASSRTATRAAPSTLEAELALLGRAQQALKSGQPNDALRALDEHTRRFPSGVLAAERMGVKTVALCQAGRLGEGRSAARSYLRIVPNSVLSKRIRIACQLSGE